MDRVRSSLAAVPVRGYKCAMADKTFSLLEFAAFCFEKNEVMDGWSPRWTPYRDPELAREQYARLIKEATSLLGEPSREIKYGVCWPGHLSIQVEGSAVMVCVAASKGGAYWVWGDSDPDWEHVNASDDLTRLFSATPDK
jgi:hypothetical protein